MSIQDTGEDLALTLPPNQVIDAMVYAMRLAPSGGNAQPWSIHIVNDRKIAVWLVPERTSLMDVGHRGSRVAIGTALFNGVVTAAHYSFGVLVQKQPEGPNSNLMFTIELTQGDVDLRLATLYPAMIRRRTTRHFGVVRSLEPELVAELQQDAVDVGAKLHVITDRSVVGKLANVVAESDRIRYLTPGLYTQMMGELVRGPSGIGIEEETLALDLTDREALRLVRDPDVMACLRELDSESSRTLGVKLGDGTRDRMNRSSAIAVLTAVGDSPLDYLRGGWALEQLWVILTLSGLDVQPMSPVFLYAGTEAELARQSPEYYRDLGGLQREFNQIVGLESVERPILVLRVSHPDPGGLKNVVRSRRLSSELVVVDDRVKR